MGVKVGNKKIDLIQDQDSIVSVKNLCFAYPGKNENVLNNLNFNINKGEIFGFLGPSGAGKSTTQKILTGILKGFSGNVSVMNQDISNVDSAFYEKIGVSFEFPNLYLRFTARENLEYFSSLYNVKTEDALNLLEMVGLKEAADIRVEKFSKGMKMRLNFCRSLINKPELLFLDEPTSGLDPGNARIIKDIIHEKSIQGKTIFLTTHNMLTVDDLCDRVAFIVEGEIVLIDDPQNLKNSYGSKDVEIRYINDNENKRKVFDLNRLYQNKEFLNLLKENEVESIHSREADLEEVFIKVTGRKLR
ncbi:MAG: ABC transporter ATP-binding protein [Bacillota bacterium]